MLNFLNEELMIKHRDCGILAEVGFWVQSEFAKKVKVDSLPPTRLMDGHMNFAT
jgi:hypothetical protein